MRCLKPYASHELWEAETWLDEQAKNGRRLKKWGSVFVSFEDAPEEGEFWYCLDADKGRNEPEPDRRAENQAKGWEYVCFMEAYVHVYRARRECEKFSPDRECSAFAAGKYRNDGIVTALLAAVWLGLICYTIPYGYWLLALMQGRRGKTLFLVFFIPYFLISLALEAVSRMRLAGQLKKGKVRGSQKGKQKRIPDGAWTLSYVVLLVLYLVFCLFFDRKTYLNIDKTGPGWYPIADIRNLEGEGFKLGDFKSNDEPDINQCNRLQVEPVLFADAHYETAQSGNNGPEYFVSLWGEYWEIGEGRISKLLYEQLVTRYTEYPWLTGITGRKRLATCEWDVSKAADPQFVNLTIASGKEGTAREGTTLIFAQTDRYVIYLEYNGNAEPDRLIGLLRSMQ